MALLSRTVWSLLNFAHCNISSIQVKSLFTKRKECYLLTYKQVRKCHGKEGSSASAILSAGISFDNMVDNRRNEARRSIVIQVQSKQSASELYFLCSQYGSVKSMHHYSLPGPSHYIIVEFDKEADVDNVLHNSGHLDSSQIVPVRSPFLWFRIRKEKANSVPDIPCNVLVGEEEDRLFSTDDLNERMHQVESVSDQVLILHKSTKLGDIGCRLRFLTAFQMELALGGPFPNIRAYPFGSTVNGFGRINCDLDLVLNTTKEEASTDCRLIFHAKNTLTNERTQMQRHMEIIGDVCQLFLPGCANVRRILQARVPIVKYRQEFTGVECDLSMTNMSGVYMSELLYVLGEVDKRVRPLVIAVRTWARDVGLTNPSPGRWITNFSLTLLVLFFLQQTKPAILPTLNQMISLASTSDARITAEGVNCTFVRSINKLCKFMDKQRRNTDSLEELLLNFFEFYCSFDFGSHAISLGSGTLIPKPEHCAIYISNPLERGLNVSKNVSLDEMERLRIEFRNAAWVLEANMKRPDSKLNVWGLTAICQAPKLQGKGHNVLYVPSHAAEKSRTFDVTKLFSEEFNIDSVKQDSKKTNSLEKKVLNAKVSSVQMGEKLVKKPTVRAARRKK